MCLKFLNLGYTGIKNIGFRLYCLSVTCNNLAIKCKNLLWIIHSVSRKGASAKPPHSTTVAPHSNLVHPPPTHRTPGANGVLDASTAKGISTNAFIALSSSDHAIAWLYVTAWPGLQVPCKPGITKIAPNKLVRKQIQKCIQWRHDDPHRAN